MKIYKLLLLFIVSISMASCTVATLIANKVGIADTKYYVELLRSDWGDNPNYIVKVIPELSNCSDSRIKKLQYMFWGQQCDLGRVPPNKLTITYTKWKSSSQIPDNYIPYMQQYADSLPLSAWQTYTIYPRQIQEQLAKQKNLNQNTYLGKGLLIKLVIDKNGIITQSADMNNLRLDPNPAE